jgi:hypothetical protein
VTLGDDFLEHSAIRKLSLRLRHVICSSIRFVTFGDDFLQDSTVNKLLPRLKDVLGGRGNV